jgi:hypothetical protein
VKYGPLPERELEKNALMHRMGDSSMRAALIYQHATSERHREIAAGIDKRLSRERDDDGEDGAASELPRKR